MAEPLNNGTKNQNNHCACPTLTNPIGEMGGELSQCCGELLQQWSLPYYFKDIAISVGLDSIFSWGFALYRLGHSYNSTFVQTLEIHQSKTPAFFKEYCCGVVHRLFCIPSVMGHELLPLAY